MTINSVGTLSLATLLCLAACSGGGTPFMGRRCVHEREIETCTCSHEYTNCKCQTTTCNPGVCVESSEGALCSPSDTLTPACNQVAATCEGTVLYRCMGGYRELQPTPCDGVCVTAGGQGLCAASPEPWPGCDQNVADQRICGSDTDIFDCQFGFRRAATPTYRGPRCFEGQRCVSSATTAACVPEQAPTSDACQPDDMFATRCLGTTQVTCVLGHIVENVKCRTCQDGQCNGRFQSTCSKDDDCAQGLTCLLSAPPKDSYGQCTAPCTGPEVNNPQCLSLEVDTSLPYNAAYGTCTAGYCGL